MERWEYNIYNGKMEIYNGKMERWIAQDGKMERWKDEKIIYRKIDRKIDIDRNIDI